jgi:peroxiredoxin
MKRLLYLLILAMVIAACSSEPGYVIKGDIEGSDQELFYLHRVVDGRIVAIDSAVSKKGSFKMKGVIDYPDLVQLVAMDNGGRINFYLENTEITLSGNIDSLEVSKISGSKTHDEYQSLIDASKEFNEQAININTEYQMARQTNNEAKMALLEKEIVALEDQMITMQKDFVKNNPSSYVAPAVLRSISYYMEGDEIADIISAMDADMAKLPIVKELDAMATALKAVSIGQKAPDFTMNDVDGNPVSLSSKIGSKLLLLDFWAGWCNPCRLENPNLVKIYKQFNKKGFDIFGVSLDQEKDSWVKAIADDKLTWTHVSDLQYWNNSAAKLYSIRAIPANFLLDESGTIIARNLRGDELLNKVQEVLGQ